MKYYIDKDKTYIKCLTCNKKSFNRNDVEYRYCGYCKEFHNIGEQVFFRVV